MAGTKPGIGLIPGQQFMAGRLPICKNKAARALYAKIADQDNFQRMYYLSQDFG
jgi:hypothetical protein